MSDSDAGSPLGYKPLLSDHPVDVGPRSVRTNMQGIFGRSYSGEIDAFAVYCPATDGVYVVPIEDATGAGMRLRIEPPLNRQTRRVNWASEYELPG